MRARARTDGRTGPRSTGRDTAPGRDDALLQAADRLAAAAEILVSVSARTAVAVDGRLSPPLLRALTLVGTDPGLTLAALAERAQISRSRASRVCDTLEEAGLLARSPRTEDRRGVGLSLTGRGRSASTGCGIGAPPGSRTPCCGCRSPI